MTWRTDTRKLTRMALLLACALLLHYLEGLLPPLFPGLPAKLGLANAAVLLALDMLGAPGAAMVQIARCALGPLLGGSPVGVLYSLLGGALSLLAMLPLGALRRKRPGAISLVGVSVAGAFFHSLGQLAMGALLISPAVFAYFTPMQLLSVLTGVCVGVAATLAARIKPGAA